MKVLPAHLEHIEGVLAYKVTEALLLIDPFVTDDIAEICTVAGSLKQVKATFKAGLSLE